MNKDKVSLLIILLAVVIFFSSAALCNQCAITPSTTSEKIGETTAKEATSVTETSAKETTAKETAASVTEATEPEVQETPTISLAISEGPIPAGNDVCYYRVLATVTGKPAPTISFSKDDSNGAWGNNKVQINIAKSSPSYTLTATAKNSAGTATASITLDYGPLPVEKTIVFHPYILGSITPSSVPSFTQVGIGTFLNEDARGRFAFDVNPLAGKEIVDAELKLANPYITNPPPSVNKGIIVINYNDFLPDISNSDYAIAAYAEAGKFDHNTDPLVVSNDYIKTKIAERALANTPLQFGIGYWFMNLGNSADSARIYQASDITLTVKYNE